MRAWALAEWALVPLRLFLGVTFTFAGLQKLANPNFFNAASPSSIHAQLVAAARVSPIRALVAHLVGLATPLGIVIAIAEVAIGVATLVGLWTRVAAVGGAVLAFSLFLTVSFHASPYYTGADLVFFFAWLPFVVAGGGSRTSIDGWTARRAAVVEHTPSPVLVPIAFAQVQRLCGHFQAGLCDARGGLACEAGACPVLAEDLAESTAPGARHATDRRALLLGVGLATLVGATASFVAAAAAGIGRAIGGAPPPVAPHQLRDTATAPSTATAGGPGVMLGPATDVPVRNAATFTIAANGDPGIVIQPVRGQFDAFNAVCPHAGCTVGYDPAQDIIQCPCHGSQFDVVTGAVLVGPAPHGLTRLDVVESGGNLYLT